MDVLTEDWQNGGFGLYLHWPFCQSKCPYCDFNSHVSSSVDQARWQHAFLSEIERVGEETGGRVLNTVFFGGGTPSLMDPALVSAIIEKISDTWTLANDVEISLEANPTSIEARRFRGYRDAGVNRVSMGAQALNDEDLKRLGRLHSAAEAMEALDIARKTFDRVSFDLIYARQHQALDDWRAELDTALSLSLDHLSLYQLTIEQGTAFGDRFNRGRLGGLPDDNASADMYLATQEICDTAGLSAYEVSNHAKNGFESRHNLIYWRYGDYAGIGPGAHGRLTLLGEKTAIETHSYPQKWLEAVEGTGTGEMYRELVKKEDQALEYLMMSLRLAEGMDLDRFHALAGHRINPLNINRLADLGMVFKTRDRLVATPNGRVLLNSVLSELLAE
ncbi:radical SAM family heme chaperone HemW [Pseudohalocynthiibacter aestuariivivens]|uniref:Heme chaperone HemW n=1 Tax=Pseudohalocynthiibacter aestuariivivens TaxID=1591409 RepID=A0ABV5JMR3_9RHOB|nr:radical SAM family heme chaperone HemW [Pseudohalocynthiibacter aestuariivivens]MBS9717651.1 coproporphyrinogen III oxidase [Pseudohalocynthiibacter aestuariivivens]